MVTENLLWQDLPRQDCVPGDPSLVLSVISLSRSHHFLASKVLSVYIYFKETEGWNVEWVSCMLEWGRASSNTNARHSAISWRRKRTNTHITSFGLDLMGILVKTANSTPKPKCRLGMVKLGLGSNPQGSNRNTCWNLPKAQTLQGTWGHKNSGMILRLPRPKKTVNSKSSCIGLAWYHHTNVLFFSSVCHLPYTNTDICLSV